jgi:hypothetical protein
VEKMEFMFVPPIIDAFTVFKKAFGNVVDKQIRLKKESRPQLRDNLRGSLK